MSSKKYAIELKELLKEKGTEIDIKTLQELLKYIEEEALKDFAIEIYKASDEAITNEDARNQLISKLKQKWTSDLKDFDEEIKKIIIDEIIDLPEQTKNGESGKTNLISHRFEAAKQQLKKEGKLEFVSDKKWRYVKKTTQL